MNDSFFPWKTLKKAREAFISSRKLWNVLQYNTNLNKKAGDNNFLWPISTQMVAIAVFLFSKKIRVLIYVLWNFKWINFCADYVLWIWRVFFLFFLIIRAKYRNISLARNLIYRIYLWNSHPRNSTYVKNKKSLWKIPAGNYVLKVNNRNTRTKCEICLKLTIKTPVSLLLTLNIFHTLF